MTNFFEQVVQMGVLHAMLIELQAEVIEAISDLADFDKDSLQQVADNLQHPGGVMASMKSDNWPNGMQNDFEEAAAHLLPYDPVTNKHTAGTKRNVGYISSTDASGLVSSVSMKVSIGKTGVLLRYHCHHEYQDLHKEQKHKLFEWCKNNPDAHKNKLNTKK